MNRPSKATHFGKSPDGRLIWYMKGSHHWFYITNKAFQNNPETNWQKCINKPTILLMKLGALY